MSELKTMSKLNMATKLSLIGVIVLYFMNNIRVSMASTLLLQANNVLAGPGTYSTFVTFTTIIECTLVPFYLKMNAGYKTRRLLIGLGGIVFAADFILLTTLNNMVAIQWIFLLVAVSSGLIKSGIFSYINTVAGPEAGKWIGINGICMSASKLINLGLGVAIDVGTYRLATGIIAAVVAAAAALVIFCSPKEVEELAKTSASKLKVFPTLCFSVMLCSLLSAMTFATNKKLPWGSTGNLILLAVFVVAMILHVMNTRRLGNEAPLPLSVFKEKRFVILICISVCFTVITMPYNVFMPLYMQKAMGTGATAATTLALCFMPLGVLLGAPVGAHISRTKNAKLWLYMACLISFVCAVYGLLVFSPTVNIIAVFAIGVVHGCLSIVGPTVIPAAMTLTVPKELAHHGSPIIAMTTPFGASLGTAFVMGFFQSMGAADAKNNVFIMMAVCAVILAVLVTLLPKVNPEK